MHKLTLAVILLMMALLTGLAACTGNSPATQIPGKSTDSPLPETGACQATSPDALGPFYTPGAPERDSVGEGYLLQGKVLSVEGCSPISGAKIEIWMAGPDGNYADEYRASLTSGADGSYSFSSHPPPPYSGRPPHIHLRVSAPGYETLVTQHYPEEGKTEAIFDVVLIPQG